MPRSTTGKGDPASEEMRIEMADLPSHDAQTEESPVHSEVCYVLSLLVIALPC